MSLLLDTNVYCAFKSGNREIITILEETDQIIVPAIVIGELLSGFMQGSRFDRNNRELDEFLRQPGTMVHDISTADALAYGGRILTRDAHFERIPGIIPIGWD